MKNTIPVLMLLLLLGGVLAPRRAGPEQRCPGPLCSDTCEMVLLARRLQIPEAAWGDFASQMASGEFCGESTRECCCTDSDCH